jgi:hypothetical protein
MLNFVSTPAFVTLTPVNHGLTLPKQQPSNAKKLLLLLYLSLVGLAYALLLPIAGLVTLGWIAWCAFCPASPAARCKLLWESYLQIWRLRRTPL